MPFIEGTSTRIDDGLWGDKRLRCIWVDDACLVVHRAVGERYGEEATTTANVSVGVAAVAGRQRDRKWFARADIHEQVRVICHTEVGAAVAKTSVGWRCRVCV